MTNRIIELRDPTQMRALAHPLRLRILAALQEDGPATASALAGRFGESVALLSYHLRQLARHGYVEEAPELGRNRKERPWRAAGVGERFAPGVLQRNETRPAANALLAELVDAAARRFFDYLDRMDAQPPEWQQALVYQGRTIFATPEEIHELRERIADVLAPYERAQPGDRPSGSRLVRVSVQGVPEVPAAPPTAE
jgi:DNA-binding transcriptional ArsR family regulator